ncbi:MAG: flagellar biosynthesis anti-sigma factor FlgM [Phycisphaerae bacterium]|jgi:anti-sigma28 factor (negative regulator of flagellin synthesis)|nr:flagellar biosynthesis anti-sigma factor FlgM [Phycisphaerae bacterium]
MVDEIRTSGARFGATPLVRLGGYSRIGGLSQESSGGVEVTDKVEISELAALRSKYAQLPEIRQELVDRVRQEIASGRYETAEKLDQAIENLLEDLK